MALYKIADYYPDYKNELGDHLADIKDYSVYSGDEQVGSVKDALVDESGRFRYLVVDTGFWIFGKNVLLPIGLTNFDYSNGRIYANGMTKEQVENLPEYNESEMVDEAYENRVRDGYRPLADQRATRQFMGQTYVADGEYYAGDRTVTPEQGVTSTSTSQAYARSMDEQVGYDYEREPTFYGMSEMDNHRPLRLYEERLVTSKSRYKAGEVTAQKHIETETVEASAPARSERVVVERRTVDSGVPAAGTSPDFREGEVARMEVYEEDVTIEKQPFVREEVTLRKEVDEETVRAEERVRKETLDVNTSGEPVIERADR